RAPGGGAPRAGDWWQGGRLVPCGSSCWAARPLLESQRSAGNPRQAATAGEGRPRPGQPAKPSLARFLSARGPRPARPLLLRKAARWGLRWICSGGSGEHRMMHPPSPRHLRGSRSGLSALDRPRITLPPVFGPLHGLKIWRCS
ncbi:hypothetical protein T310_8797, partial [Rasamsonia emersonii CBS 393.64]